MYSHFFTYCIKGCKKRIGTELYRCQNLSNYSILNWRIKIIYPICERTLRDVKYSKNKRCWKYHCPLT